ncbi:hypothetical protein H4582DRAFT_2072658 [Lactarius indigo]|nr:hypothetical protein H4582DRAFT_2072658 [Lactarius indigo]
MPLPRRACWFSGRPPRLRIPHHLRPLTTAISGDPLAQSSVASSSRTVLALALGGAFLGLGGYYVGTRSNGVNVEGATLKSAGISISIASKADLRYPWGLCAGDRRAQGVACGGGGDDGAGPAGGARVLAKFSSPGLPHSVVVYPSSTEDVVKIVNVARKYRMPIVSLLWRDEPRRPLYGRTYLPLWRGGGICVDMSEMDKIISIHEEDSDLICQPGVGWMEINQTLKEKGIPLFFPLDPGPTATIGGMLSTGCSGTNAVRYGTAKGEWFLNATVVLPSGEVIKTRRRSRKSSAGFDTTKLFVGAEGTLGIVTEVTIRLAPVIPTTVATARFPDVRKASEAVIEILNTGIGIQCIELVDAAFMRMTMATGNPARKYDIADHLFFKLQGATPAALAEAVDVSEEEAAAMWTDRKNAHYSGLAYAGEGAKAWVNRRVLVYETQKDIERSGIMYFVLGHAGDGNFHTFLAFKTDEELKTVRGLVHRMVKRALALDGTCSHARHEAGPGSTLTRLIFSTGEHVSELGKKEFLVEELGAGTVALMKTIKRTIDPLGIMNPGKLYPDDECYAWLLNTRVWIFLSTCCIHP